MASNPYTLKWGIMATGWIAESESKSTSHFIVFKTDSRDD